MHVPYSAPSLPWIRPAIGLAPSGQSGFGTFVSQGKVLIVFTIAWPCALAVTPSAMAKPAKVFISFTGTVRVEGLELSLLKGKLSRSRELFVLCINMLRIVARAWK